MTTRTKAASCQLVKLGFPALLLTTLAACSSGPKEQTTAADTTALPADTTAMAAGKSKRTVSAADLAVPAGMQIEAVTTGLSYPVDVTFDDKDNTYMAEAGGHTYGTKPAGAPEARILQILPDGSQKVLYDKEVPMSDIRSHASSADMPEGLLPPVTGVTYHQGKFYIAHRSRYSTYDLATKEFKTIVNGLPSWGEFLNAKAIFKGDKMYFFLSTQGNTGVQEKHWVKVMDIFNKPKVHEIPGKT